MANLFQKHKLLFAIAGGIFILVVIIALTSYSQSRTEVSESTAEVPDHDLSTPELIDQAYDNGEITAEYRLLYLAYAMYEYKSLPTRLLSNVAWSGDGQVQELNEAVNSPAKLCSMSPHVRSELLRLITKTDDNTACN